MSPKSSVEHDLIERVYRMLIERPRWPLEELGEALGANGDDLAAAIATLARLDLIRCEDDLVSAVAPELGMINALARTQDELLRRHVEFGQSRTALAVVASVAAERTARAEMFERLEDLEAARQRLADLAISAQWECLSFVAGGAQTPDTLDASKPLDQMALERGVQVRTIYQDSFRNDPATLRYTEWLARLGGQSRTVPSLPMVLVIVDRGAALVPLEPDNPRAGALYVTMPGVITALVALFEATWAGGRAVGDCVSRDASGLTTQQRELLRLLATGCTDEIVARKLGVHVRTVRRMMADIMARLDVHSRFQAGARAMELGLLPP